MFEGTYTALVTPFTQRGEVDYDLLGRLIERQLEGGVDGLVPVGTTGESPTLTMEEHGRVVSTTVEICRGRAQVIAGTGGNATSEAIELTQWAKEAGADATLQVTPYYNKPSQRGLVAHFAAIADLGLPVVLYNVPGRTAREISLDTVAELAQHPHVVAIKEAGGSVDRVSHMARRCPDLDILSGDDALTFPMMAVGAVGVISVAGNVIPSQVARLVQATLDGEWDEAASLHLLLHPLFCDLFLDTNPVPVKAAMAMMGLLEEVYRLPLVPMDNALRSRLETTLRTLNLL